MVYSFYGILQLQRPEAITKVGAHSNGYDHYVSPTHHGRRRIIILWYVLFVSTKNHFIKRSALIFFCRFSFLFKTIIYLLLPYLHEIKFYL